MTILTNQFEFTCNTATGTQTIATGLGFTPKAYIIYGVDVTANATFSDNPGFRWGMSDGTNQWCQAWNADDASTTSDTGRAYYNDAVLVLMDFGTPNNVVGVASHSSFGADSIVINWTDASPTAFRFMGIAFGGDDITIEVGSTTAGRSTTGTQNYSLSTVTNPEFGFFVTPGSTQAVGASSAQIHYSSGIGAAVSSSEQFVVCNASEDGLSDTDCWSYANTDACLMALEEDSGAVRFKASLSSWGTSQFTLNYTDATGLSTGDHFAYMVFEGGHWEIGNFAKRTSTGDTVVTTGTDIDTIRGIMLFSTCQNSSASVQANNRLSIGAGNATNSEGGTWYGDRDASTSQNTACRSENQNILLIATENSTHGSSTVEGLANLTDVGVETFTLTYTTCTTLAATIFYVVLGETAATAYQRSISEGSISISDSLIKKVKKTKSEGSISISDSLIKKVKKVISESSISISDSLIKKVKKVISESSISISDSLIKKVKKVISEGSYSVDDSSPSRLRTAYGIVNEGAISISDSLIKKVKKVISESTITVSDSLIKKVKKVISESVITISDAIDINSIRHISESAITVSDSVVKKVKKIISENISISDSIVKKPIKVLSETAITISDSLIKKVKKIITDSISISDSVVKKPTKVISESAITISDNTPTVIKIYLRVINETAITISETIIKNVKKIISESVSISDTVVKKAIKVLSEASISISDSVDINNIRHISETAITISDSIIKKVKKVISESVSISDNIIKKIKKIISEGGITINDSVIAILHAIKIIAEGAISISDNLIKKVKKVINDSTISISDTVVKKAIKRLGESVVIISDNVVAFSGDFLVIITENPIIISDSVLKFKRILGDAVGRAFRSLGWRFGTFQRGSRSLG